jgi:hypothetical protein
MTIAPSAESSRTIVLSSLGPGPPLVASFALFDGPPSSTSENALLVPLEPDEAPLVVFEVSWVPLDGFADFLRRGITEAGVSSSEAAGMGRSTPLIGLPAKGSILRAS